MVLDLSNIRFFCQGQVLGNKITKTMGKRSQARPGPLKSRLGLCKYPMAIYGFRWAAGMFLDLSDIRKPYTARPEIMFLFSRASMFFFQKHFCVPKVSFSSKCLFASPARFERKHFEPKRTFRTQKPVSAGYGAKRDQI